MAVTTNSTSTSSPDSTAAEPAARPRPRGPALEALVGWFGLDVRALATLRIGLGLVNFVDVAWRMQDIGVFYSDGGLFSTESARAYFRQPYNYSLYYLDGSQEFATFLMVVHLVVTACLILGFRSRTTAALCWALLLSLHYRNPMVLNGGDVLIRSLLFWSMFLPIGEVWSIDARSRHTGPRRTTILSPASAALVLQMLLLYFSAGFFKWNQDWLSGEALDWALRLETYNRPIAERFVEFTTLTWAGTVATPLVESYLPLLWFLPGLLLLALAGVERASRRRFRLTAIMPAVQTFVRFAIVLTFAAFHLPIEILMWIGYFSYICWAGLIALIPTGAWEVAARYVRGLRVVETLAPRTRGYVVGEALRGVLATVLVAYVVLWNVRNARDMRGYESFSIVLPEKYDGLACLLGLSQKWNMFQHGPRAEGWAAAHVLLLDGEERNILFRGGPADFSRPRGLRGMFPTDRWRKFFNNLGNEPDDRYADEVALALARRWNATHGDEEQIFSLDLYWLTQAISRDGSSRPIQKKLLHRVEWAELYGDAVSGEGASREGASGEASDSDPIGQLKALAAPRRVEDYSSDSSQ